MTLTRFRHAISCFVWIGIFVSAPVNAYDAELWTHYTSQNTVTSIAEGEDEIFFGTSGGVRRYHRFRQTWLRTITTAEGLPDNFVRQISYNPDTGDLDIETRTGTARWMSRLEALTPGGFIELSQGNYIPRIPNVVPPFGYYINRDIIRGPDRNYRILDALVDSWNNLWIATDGLGVGRADLTFNQLEFLQSGPLGNNVTALDVDGSSIWIGGQTDFSARARGISRFDRETEKWHYYESGTIPRLDDAEISDVLSDTANVWFATDQGVIRYYKSNETWDTYRYSRGSSTRHIRHTRAMALGNDRLWLGTERGLAVLDLKADTLRAVKGSHTFRIRDLATSTKYIWAATHKGLFRSPVDDVTWSRTPGPSAAHQPILAVDTAGDSTWALAAAPPTLLISVHPDSTWTTQEIPEAAGSTEATLSVSGHRAWIGTESGVIRVNTLSGKSSELTAIDGLLDDYVQVVRLEGDTVWIGTRNGLSLYRWKDDFRDPED